jgi:E3 ubiquitin-protein ligase MARCH5
MVQLLDLMEKTISKSCPYIAGGLFLGATYWSAVTYGAITVMQVMGHKEGLTLMEAMDPLLLLVGLPTIPVGLVLAKMTRWEDYILQVNSSNG